MTDLTQTMAAIFVDGLEEIQAARAKHGPQKHLPLINRHEVGLSTYGMQADTYKARCEAASRRGSSSWDFILLEEVFEALEAIQEGNLVEGRKELVQVLAMAASMIEIVDDRLADSNMLETTP